MPIDRPDAPEAVPGARRRPYTAPVIEQVRIVPEEAILSTTCKTSPVSGGGSLNTCGSNTGCGAVGS